MFFQMAELVKTVATILDEIFQESTPARAVQRLYARGHFQLMVRFCKNLLVQQARVFPIRVIKKPFFSAQHIL